MIRRRLGPFGLLDAADLDVADYNAIVVDRHFARDPAMLRQILRALRKLNLARVRKVRDGMIDFATVDQSVHLSAMDYHAHEVELTAPVDGWQARILKPDFARYLRSKRKRLAAKGAAAFEQVSDPCGIRAAFESMRRFRQDRWESDLLRDPAHFEFYLDIAISGSRSGFARTYVLTVNGNVLSVLFGVYHNGRFCFLLLGFDRQKFGNYSTGLLILENVIEDCIQRKNDVFDLTIGDEAYKQNFATRTVPMSALWIGRKPWTRLAPIAVTAAKKARAFLRKYRETGRQPEVS
jgi:CelD/BcsL family acetyltransferase involved in cellulose biosynthesis